MGDGGSQSFHSLFVIRYWFTKIALMILDPFNAGRGAGLGNCRLRVSASK
jgi:hypothetical protein